MSNKQIKEGEGVEGQKAQRLYTKGEVAKHATLYDCWLIIRGKVYDVTPFAEEHPGGFVILEVWTGWEGERSGECTIYTRFIFFRALARTRRTCSMMWGTPERHCTTLRSFTLGTWPRITNKEMFPLMRTLLANGSFWEYSKAFGLVVELLCHGTTSSLRHQHHRELPAELHHCCARGSKEWPRVSLPYNNSRGALLVCKRAHRMSKPSVRGEREVLEQTVLPGLLAALEILLLRKPVEFFRIVLCGAIILPPRWCTWWSSKSERHSNAMGQHHKPGAQVMQSKPQGFIARRTAIHAHNRQRAVITWAAGPGFGERVPFLPPLDQRPV